MKLLVVAAWEPELARFRARLDGKGRLSQLGLDVTLQTLGVGLVEASLATAECVARLKPTGVLLLGTCGAFARTHRVPAGLVIGAVCAGADVCLADGAVAAENAAFPGPMPTKESFDGGLCDVLVAAGAIRVRVANTIAMTTDDASAAVLCEATSCDVEHLEAFAVARACAVLGVPCAAVLGVANLVGARGHADWLAHHVEVSARAGDVAFEALSALASALRDYAQTSLGSS